jgi:DNA-binding transcriptional MerR regulator
MDGGSATGTGTGAPDIGRGDDDPARITVGALAREVGLTARALRHYDRLGVFRPAGVDADTGYRWYAADQLPRARLIARLRAAGVPLDAVRTWVTADGDPEVADRLLEQHRRRLEARLTRVRGDLHRLAHLRDGHDEPTPEGAPELSPAPPTRTTSAELDERRLAADLFNGVWALMETEERTADDDDRMLHMAHASRYHWGSVGTPANLARGEWLCSRVYAVLGRPEPSLHHARRVLDLCRRHGLLDWDLAFAHEALARAHALAGDAAAAQEAIRAARAVVIAGDEDRSLLEADLATVPV